MNEGGISDTASVAVSQHSQDPENEATKLNSLNIYFIIYTCAFPAVICGDKKKLCNKLIVFGFVFVAAPFTLLVIILFIHSFP